MPRKASLSFLVILVVLGIAVTLATGNAWLSYLLSRTATEEGLHSIAARAAARFAGPDSGAPPQVLALAYPLVYPRIVSDEAEENDISPHLLLALVRQESFYDARAVSPAWKATVIPASATRAQKGS